MASVTQRVNNFLGGVSRQSDDKKLSGQVTECLNGYPEPTFGLTKRPGFKHLANLATGTTLDNAKWFYINRDEDEKYIGCITPKPDSGNGGINIWNATSGTACNITYTGNAQDYLTGAKTNYHILSVQDTTLISNNLISVAKQADPTFIANTRATLILSDTAISSTYSVTINAGGGASDQTFTTTTSATETYDGLLTTLANGIYAFNITGLVVTKFLGGLQLERVISGTRTAFTISCKGGPANNKLSVFQDQVDNVSQLPPQTFHDHIVKIINTNSANDTYFAQFVADDGVSGQGHWEEGRDPSKSAGLNNATMPHELINTGTNAFTFKEVSYTARLVGDDKTNSHPSFVGSKIQQAFFHNNRLGFLSGDNVSLSQAGEFFNFYHISAQTVTAADPVDLSCSSIRPAALHAVIPTPQGLVLFSSGQQFLMYSDSGVLTPALALIRTISNYEMDTVIDPVDNGDVINFLSKTPSYSRTFAMITRGEEQNPQVFDISRVVKEWIPSTIDSMIASPQNRMLVMSSQSSKYVYIFKTYNDGEKNVLESWFNWELPGNVQTLALDSDDMYAVTKQGNQVTLSLASLSQSPEQAIIVNSQGQKVNPCIDLYKAASSVVYDSVNNRSKCYLPFNDVTDLTPVIVIAGSTATGQFVESGFTITPERSSDGTGPFFIVPNKDLTSVASNVIVGFKYELNVVLPRTYFNLNQESQISDFTASLIISRMKFAVGLSGVMSFKLFQKDRLTGSRSYTGDGTTTDFNWIKENINYIDRDQIKVKVNNVETTAFSFLSDTEIRFSSAPANGASILIYMDKWYSINPIPEANYYLANDVPLDNQSIFTIPIHQRSKNFELRVFNDSPFPVSLNSMMWEGHYTPRFYKRV